MAPALVRHSGRGHGWTRTITPFLFFFFIPPLTQINPDVVSVSIGGSLVTDLALTGLPFTITGEAPTDLAPGPHAVAVETAFGTAASAVTYTVNPRPAVANADPLTLPITGGTVLVRQFFHVFWLLSVGGSGANRGRGSWAWCLRIHNIFTSFF